MDWMWGAATAAAMGLRAGSLAAVAAATAAATADGDEEDEEEEDDAQPILEPYDPRKPEYVLPAWPQDIEVAELEILRRQADRLSSALRRQGARCRPKVRLHYEQILLETRRRVAELTLGLQQRRDRGPELREEACDDDEASADEGLPASRCPSSGAAAGQARFGGRAPGWYFCHSATPSPAWPLVAVQLFAHAGDCAVGAPRFCSDMGLEFVEAEVCAQPAGQEQIIEGSTFDIDAHISQILAAQPEVRQGPGAGAADDVAGMLEEEEHEMGVDCPSAAKGDDRGYLSDLETESGFGASLTCLPSQSTDDAPEPDVALRRGVNALGFSPRKRSSACCDEELEGFGFEIADSEAVWPEATPPLPAEPQEVGRGVMVEELEGGPCERPAGPGCQPDVVLAESEVVREDPEESGSASSKDGTAAFAAADPAAEGARADGGEQPEPLLRRLAGRFGWAARARAEAKGASMLDLSSIACLSEDEAEAEEDACSGGPRPPSESPATPAPDEEDVELGAADAATASDMTPPPEVIAAATGKRRRSHCRGPSLLGLEVALPPGISVDADEAGGAFGLTLLEAPAALVAPDCATHHEDCCAAPGLEMEMEDGAYIDDLIRAE